MEGIASEGRRLRWLRTMVGLILFGLVFRIVLQVYPPLEPVYQYILALPYVAFAALVFYDTGIAKQRGYRLLLVCFFYAVLSSFFHTYDFNGITKLLPYFLMMLFAFGMCYPLAFVLPEERASRAFAAIGASFVTGITALSAIGCYTAVARVMIENPGRGEYEPCGVVFGRLSIFAYPTAAAVFCALSVLLTAYLFLRCKRVFPRVLLVLSGVITFVALSLTGGRIATVFLCVCLGGVGYLAAEDRLPVKKSFLRIAVALAVAVAVAAAGYAGSVFSVRAVNALSDAVVGRSASVSVTALAAPTDSPVVIETETALPALFAEQSGEAENGGAFDDPDKYATETKDRSLFENISTLQGRTYAWEGALCAMAADPMLLLFGSSPVYVMDRVDPFVPENTEAEGFFHLHSIYFQTLVSFGVIGALLFAAAIFYILYHAVRLFFLGRGVCGFCERSLPLLLFFCLGVDLLEIFLTFSDVTKMSNPLFFLTAGYVVYLSETRLPGKRKRNAASGTEG